MDVANNYFEIITLLRIIDRVIEMMQLQLLNKQGSSGNVRMWWLIAETQQRGGSDVN
jgi:hypothetical protein